MAWRRRSTARASGSRLRVGPRASTMRAVTRATSEGRAARASSTNQIPPAKSSSTARPTSNASRLLPTPGGPIRLTSRCRATSSAASASACWRPTKELTGAGRRPRSATAAGTLARAGSWARMPACSRCTPGPGSTPSCSASTCRARRKLSNASAWRPLRYWASINWPQRRSRNGCSSSSRRIRSTTSAWSPSASAASNCSSKASIRSASRRAASAPAHRLSGRPCSGRPCHNANARATSSAARPASPARWALRAVVSSSSNRTASTVALASAYPSGAAAIESAPSAARSRETWCWTALRGAAGTSAPHKASTSTSTGTTRPPSKASSASSAGRLGPVTSARRPSTKASNGPRSRISREVVMAAGPRLPERQSGTPRRACEPPHRLFPGHLPGRRAQRPLPGAAMS